MQPSSATAESIAAAGRHAPLQCCGIAGAAAQRPFGMAGAAQDDRPTCSCCSWLAYASSGFAGGGGTPKPPIPPPRPPSPPAAPPPPSMPISAPKFGMPPAPAFWDEDKQTILEIKTILLDQLSELAPAPDSVAPERRGCLHMQRPYLFGASSSHFKVRQHVLWRIRSMRLCSKSGVCQ